MHCYQSDVSCSKLSFHVRGVCHGVSDEDLTKSHFVVYVFFHSNNVDVIVFSVHTEAWNQCVDDAEGTYITPVPNFMEGYLTQYLQTQQDKGNDDYALPDASQYVYCTRVVKNGEEYWLQLGCADGTSQELAVNIYSDNTCTTRSSLDGMDDANVDVSEMQVCKSVCTRTVQSL